jgi:hypothetical protein
MIVVPSLKKLVKFKIGDLVFHSKPLSYLERAELASLTNQVGKDPVVNLIESQAYLIKHTLKKCEGLKIEDGGDYEFEFEGDLLTDDCVSELFSIEPTALLRDALAGLAMPLKDGKILNIYTQEALEGVEIVKDKSRVK